MGSLTVLTLLLFLVSAQAQLLNLPSFIPTEVNPDSVWARMEKLFIFGDSWSNTDFNWSGIQPSPSAPFGNPAGNYTPADVVEHGARWPVYLTTTYNASLLETYVLAQSGAVVNNTLTPHYGELTNQVEFGFIRNYGDANSGFWNPFSSLFILFFGVNDASLIFEMEESKRNYTLNEVIKNYNHNIERLYESGARNFLIMNTPPMDLAPNAKKGLRSSISQWNARIKFMVKNLGQKYHSKTDASTSMNIFEFDTNKLLTNVITAPNSDRETVDIKNVTSYCDEYSDGGRHHGPEFFNASCGTGLKLGEYFWVDGLHPTPTIFRFIAAEIAKLFSE